MFEGREHVADEKLNNKTPMLPPSPDSEYYAYKRPNYCGGLNLDPEVEKYVNDMMKDDPRELQYRLVRELGDIGWEELAKEWESGQDEFHLQMASGKKVAHRPKGKPPAKHPKRGHGRDLDKDPYIPGK
jgi:hypothetical protein